VKTVRQSLIDYEMAQLKAIAACRAIPLPASNQAEAVASLVAALLSPAAIAITLTDLSGPETEALQLLLDHGGAIEGPRFTRQYGVIRPMGPARLERERPWEKPVNPAEGLWYRGLIFKAFQHTDQGNLEMFFIPTDLRPLLSLSDTFANDETPASDQKPGIATQSPGPGPAAWSISATTAPAVTVSGHDRLRENIFSLLVYLQTKSVRLAKDNTLSDQDKAALASGLLPPLHRAFQPQSELDFLLHLGRRTGLLAVKHERLRPDPDPTRAWLQTHPTQQQRFLQHAWRTDPTWNELWRVPDLLPQPTGWENSPLLARSKILDYLAQLNDPVETWFMIDDFVAAIKRIDPDFQRPDGDYESWYIKDDRGEYVMGFENWDRVEGALIRHMLTQLLPLLGVVELGLPADNSEPVQFRLTRSGTAFLAGESTLPRPDEKPGLLRVDNNFLTTIPAQASLYDRFQLARFAELERREPHRVVYQITQASVGRAMRNGVTVDQIVTFLGRATNNRTPLKVVESLRTWGQRRDTVQIERATLLRLKHEALAAELRQHPGLGKLLGERVGPTTFLVPADNVTEVRRLLMELGYLEG
jgi:hypothetical protein